MGHLYKRGNIYWIKYYRNGKPHRESSGSKKEADARRLLRKREGQIAEGKTPGIHFDKVKFEELAEDFLRDYRLNNKTVKRAEQAMAWLGKFFEGYRVTAITTPLIEAFIEDRMQATCANCRNDLNARLRFAQPVGKRKLNLEQPMQPSTGSFRL
jgi:hypothetical protein